MNPRGVWIVGAGARVKDAFLPVLRALQGQFEVRGLLARSDRTLESAGHSYSVRDLASLQQSDLQAGDLVVIAVSKQSVPDVLARLTSLDVSNVELLIDTPVVRFRLFHHWKRVLHFQSAWVAEDCAYLPWIETVKKAVAAGVIGDLREIRFEHSAYAYHAIATAKELTGQRRLRSGRRAKSGDVFARTMKFDGGVRAVQLEPCTYSKGSIVLRGSSGSITDAKASGSDEAQLEVILEDGLVTGFRVGEIATTLSAIEASLTAGDEVGATAIARQSAMKRVGLHRLIRGIADGRAYSIRDGLDDMVVDYHLEKFGRYYANWFSSGDSPLARFVFGAVTRIGS